MPIGHALPATGVHATGGPQGMGGIRAKVQVPVSPLSRAFQAPESGGVATIVLDAPPNGSAHLIQQLAFSTNSTSSTTATCYLGSIDTTGFTGVYSSNANQDGAAGWPPILVPSNSPFFVVFSSMSAGATATCRIQYLLVRDAMVPLLLSGAFSGAL